MNTSVKKKQSVEKSSKKLSYIQREILVGTLLGDAYLKANKKKSKYQYVIYKSGNHKEYVFHLYEIFKNYTLKPPKEYTFKDKRFPGKLYTFWSFYTTYQECFRFYAHQFYTDVTSNIYKKYDKKDDKIAPSLSFFLSQDHKPVQRAENNTLSIEENRIDEKNEESIIDNITYKRRKKVPNLIHRWLTPRAIAYWYMDDGAQKWKGKSLGVRFCTDNFSLSETETLARVLRSKYLLKTSLQKKASYYRIYVSSDSYKVLKNLIGDFLIPSMIYKFPVEKARTV